MICLEERYIKELEVINGVKFTPREIDVIACLMHGRNAKGIADFLASKDKALSHRAIETHILNIRRKIAGAAKNSIIDFVEKSDKRGLLHEYYSDLLIQKEFQTTLQEIASRTKSHVKSFLVVIYPDKGKCGFLIKKLKADLKILVSEINIELRDEKGPILLPLFSNAQQDYTICLILQEDCREFSKSIDAIRKALEKDPNNNDLNNVNVQNIIFVLRDNTALQGKLNSSDNFLDTLITKSPSIINLETHQSYYFLLLEILQKLFFSVPLEDNISRFKERYYLLHTNINDVTEVTEPQKLKKLSRHLIFALIALMLILFAIVIASYRHYNSSETTKIANITHILSQNFPGLTVRNLTKKEFEKNYKVVRQFTQVINLIKTNQIQKYFDHNNITPEAIIYCLYNLNAIASYYFFREHDVLTAEKILLSGKSLVETYVATRSKLPVNFDKLTYEEIYTELSIIQELPAIYSTTIYFLGRAAIKNNNLQTAEKYFNLSRHLGTKLDLLQGYLSYIKGLLIIKKAQAEIDIKNGNISKAKKKLIECIEIYKEACKNDKKYIRDYEPHNRNINIIVLSQDRFHIIECNKRIFELYSRLISIIKDKTELQACLAEIFDLFKGNKDYPNGVLKVLTQTTDLYSTIHADFYNNLGYFLLALYDTNLDFESIKAQIASQLKLPKKSDDLEFNYQLFELAKVLSRNTEFTKADSLDGQVKVLERRASQQGILPEEKKPPFITNQAVKTSQR